MNLRGEQNNFVILKMHQCVEVQCLIVNQFHSNIYIEFAITIAIITLIMQTHNNKY